MRKVYKRILILGFTIITLLACQTVQQWVSPIRPPLPTAAPPPTEIDPTTQQLQIFTELWTIVDEEYLYEDFNGADWNAIAVEFGEKIEMGLTDDEFYVAMDEMLLRLNDEHSVFLSPQQAADEDQEYAGNQDYVGIGVYLLSVPERDRAVILLTFPDGPAHQAGLRMRDSILTVDRMPVLDENGNIGDALRGSEGSVVRLRVQTPGEAPREIEVARARVNGALPTPFRLTTTTSGERIGYIFIPTFSISTISELVGDAYWEMTTDAPLDGLIIDNRFNDGGVDTELEGTLGYFVDGLMGNFISRSNRRPLEIKGSDLRDSQTIPLVVLVGENTVSYGEVFAGVLQDAGRATVLGETTEGNVETLWGYDFSDGSRAWIAHEAFRPLNNPMDDWEATGIIPDEIIPVFWDEHTFETDPAIQRAIQLLIKSP